MIYQWNSFKSLELCQAVANLALWSTTAAKIRCSYGSAYLIARNYRLSDNLAHNHHQVTVCCVCMYDFVSWPCSSVIKMNCHSLCRLATLVLVVAGWAGQSRTNPSYNKSSVASMPREVILPLCSAPVKLHLQNSMQLWSPQNRKGIDFWGSPEEATKMIRACLLCAKAEKVGVGEEMASG